MSQGVNGGVICPLDCAATFLWCRVGDDDALLEFLSWACVVPLFM